MIANAEGLGDGEVRLVRDDHDLGEDLGKRPVDAGRERLVAELEARLVLPHSLALAPRKQHGCFDHSVLLSFKSWTVLPHGRQW
ncbi:hypothetical protein D3C87_1994600 [compost metagenome]